MTHFSRHIAYTFFYIALEMPEESKPYNYKDSQQNHFIKGLSTQNDPGFSSGSGMNDFTAESLTV
jgi:hypothetical protein